MSTTHPTLYHKGKGGAMLQWRVWAKANQVLTEYGQVGGASQRSVKTAEPKNVGRSNETSGEQQAQLEAAAMFEFKLTRKYSLTKTEAKDTLLLPMLAQSIDKRKGKIAFPVDVQPKLDGLRMMAYRDDAGCVQLMSRSGKPYNIQHIKDQLGLLPAGAVLDGEVYCAGMTLQTINSLAKRSQPGSSALEYHVYDIPCWNNVENEAWTKRWANLEEFFNAFRKFNTSLRQVPTYRTDSYDGVIKLQQKFVAEGFEGAIVRVHSGLYLYGYRSYDLLKVKSFQDDEFKVIGAVGGRGKFEKQCIFTCETSTGIPFDVVPKGTVSQRQEYLTNAEHYIGKLLTVRYFNYTPDGKPFLPIGVSFRLDEDLPKR